MTLSELSIKNPVFAVMLSAAMIVFGYLGYRDMGVSQFPEIDFPVVSVVVTREAASPDVMDGDVTDVIEDAVAGVEGVDYIASQSLESTSIVTVYFRLHRDIDSAMQDVQNAVSGVRRRLPIDIDPPVISKVNPNNLPVIWLCLYGARPLNQISDYAENKFKQQIETVPGVGGVLFGGLRSRNIRIWVDAQKLSGFGLGADDVIQTIQRQHTELPAGYIKSSQVEFNVRTMGEAYSIGDFNNLLLAERNGQQIHLDDVAVVEDGLEDRRSLARYNRLPCVAVGVRKAIGSNLVAVCEGVKAKLPELRRGLPEGFELSMPVDYSVFVEESVDELQLTLFLGIVLTAVVCYMFLGSFGTTLNICLSIPTSLIGTFFVIRYLGFTLNLMTLLALSLSVGVVVDDAILVLENIYRHRERGEPRRQAALVGAREISFAAIAATVSIMAIFVPVAFMTGTIGRFFFQFGVTVSVAVFLSLISALTITPMFCAYFLSTRHAAPPANRPPGRSGVRGWVPRFLAGLGGTVTRSGLLLDALGGLAMLAAGTAVRLRWRGQSWAFPVVSWLSAVLPSRGARAPWAGQGRGDELVRWGIESAAEFVIGFLVLRYGPLVIALLDRYVLGFLLVKPTDWFMRRVTAGYGYLLRWSLRGRWGVVAAGAALMALAWVFVHYRLLGTELVPSEDQSRFVVQVICPVGSSIDYVDRVLGQCEDKLAARADVAGLLTTVATERGKLINQADLFVRLVPRGARRLSQAQVIAEVRRDFARIQGMRAVVLDLSTQGFTPQQGFPIDFAVQGQDWDKVIEHSARISDAMRASGLVQDIDSDYRPGMPELHVLPDRDKCAMVGVPVGTLADTVSALVGGLRVGKFTDRGKRYDVRIRLLAEQRSSPLNLPSLALRGAGGKLVQLSDVAQLEVVPTLPVINRYNHQRKIEITANTAPGVSQGEAIRRCQEIAQGVLPQGYSVVDLGNAQAMRETLDRLLFALALGVVIAYMVLGVQFNSFVHPFTVLLAMPFAITGALATLWWTGDTLNMMSMIGLILLMGLVKKNSIILVDYTNQLRAGGMGLEEAVLAACPVRLRPIVMTSAATVAGAIPAALGYGPGAETRSPMARGIIGGIVLSTLVTLIMVPVFYVLLEELGRVLRGLVVAPRAAAAAEPPAPELSAAASEA
jgi:multidrug efflux pump subunit AcrB